MKVRVSALRGLLGGFGFKRFRLSGLLGLLGFWLGLFLRRFRGFELEPVLGMGIGMY